MGLISMVLGLPLDMIRNYIFRPAIDRTYNTYEDYKARTKEGVTSAREVVFKLAVVALAAAVIIWLAIFMYIAFYYTYMPAIAHIRPVHMQFKTCNDVHGPCTFPQAHVLLTKKQQLLMVGQPYRIFVNIDMPESEQNIELGMFMVCAEMRDKSTKLRSHSCRSAMMHYRSYLARTISTLVMSPLIVFGFKDETQHIPVELFSSYEDDQSHPVTDVFVEIQSKQIQFYSVTLHITAHFSGLRYIMFHWPILSACIGIGVNLFFILIVSALSWYQWAESEWMEEAKQKLRDRAEASRRRRNHPRRYGSVSDVSSASISNDEPSTQHEKQQQQHLQKLHHEGLEELHTFDDDEEDISSIDDKSIVKLDEEIEELMAEQGMRQRKPPKYVAVSTSKDGNAEESAC